MATGPDLLYGNQTITSSVNASTSTVTIAPADNERNAFWIFNHSTAALFVKVGLSASFTDFSFKLSSGSFIQVAPPCPREILTGIWDAAVGSAKVTIIE